MGFQVTGTSSSAASNSAAGRIFQATTAYREVWLSLRPGSPDAWIGGSEYVVNNEGGFLLSPGMLVHTQVNTGEELWVRGTDPTVSSYAQVLVRTTQP